MLPEKFKAVDKVIVNIRTQDQLFQSWNAKAVETVKDLPFQRGVIICKDAIGNKNKKSDDLYLAFYFNDDFIRLEEVHGTNNTVACVWELPYEGHVEDGVKLYNLKCEFKYNVHRKRMQLLTSTFIAIMEYVALNRGNTDLLPETVENVKVVKTPKKGEPVVSYVDCVTYEIQKVTSLEVNPASEGKSSTGQTTDIVWLIAPPKQQPALTV